MKKLLLLLAVTLLTNLMSAQTPAEIEQKLGKNRMLEIVFTEELGKNLMQKGDPCNCAESTQNAGETKFFVFKEFILVSFPTKFKVKATESSELTITSRFLSVDPNNGGNEVENYEVIKQALTCIKACKSKEKKEFKQKI